MENLDLKLDNLTESEKEQLVDLLLKATAVEDTEDEEVKNVPWKPEYNEKFYHISGIGNIYQEDWLDTCCDRLMYEIGNCFKSEEEAEFEVERLKVLAEIKRIAAKDEEVEWNGYNHHYAITYNWVDDDIYVSDWIAEMYTYSPIYFAFEDRAQECVNTIGEERLKKYYFQVKE